MLRKLYLKELLGAAGITGASPLAAATVANLRMLSICARM